MLRVEWWSMRLSFGDWVEDLIQYDASLTMEEAIQLYDPFQPENHRYMGAA